MVGTADSPPVDTGATSKLKFSTGFGIAHAAISAYSSYNTAKHSAAMSEINWNHNKGMALENLKLNQYIAGRNKMNLLTASSDKKLLIKAAELKTKASAEAVQAAYGMKGGSAQQVLHSISREAAKSESSRLAELDSALFSSKLQAFNLEAQAQDTIGIKPIDSISGAIAVGSFAADTAELFQKITSK